MELPIKLQSVTKTGAITTWQVWTDGPKVIKRWGQKKLQTVEYIATPKNVGKKNATTAEEQAILEACSAAKLQMKKGYTSVDNNIEENDKAPLVVKEEQEDTTSVGSSSSSIPHILPMLAKDYNKDSKHIKFPCIVQPKLDGVRMLCNSKGEMWSRMGTLRPNNENYATLRSQILKLYTMAKSKLLFLDDGCILDGEQYETGGSFQDLVGKVKATKDTKDQLTPYHIFDLYNINKPDLIFTERMRIMHHLQSIIDTYKLSLLHIVLCKLVHTKYEIDEQYLLFMKEGYEGIIIRNNSGLYRPKHRSFDLQKFKEFQTEEYMIVDFTKATGTQEGAIVFLLALTVTEDEVTAFKCGFAGDIETRREMYLHGKDYIGKMLTVKYQELSKDMIPRFPVGISIRDYE